MNHPWKNTDDWIEDVRENEGTNSWNGANGYEEVYGNAAREPQIIQPSRRTCQQVPHACKGVSKMIEIFPGSHLPLRGADETWSAIGRDFYSPAICLDCKTAVFCIQDADFVLCPDCRVISPLNNGTASAPIRKGGVGLGFTFEQLSRWQEEILQLRAGSQAMH